MLFVVSMFRCRLFQGLRTFEVPSVPSADSTPSGSCAPWAPRPFLGGLAQDLLGFQLRALISTEVLTVESATLHDRRRGAPELTLEWDDGGGFGTNLHRNWIYHDLPMGETTSTDLSMLR